MTFSDLLKDIIDSSKDRIKTPISGAYALSFILWNWRPIALLLFENTSITQKIIVINAEYCNVLALIGPLLLGLFFTIGIPYLMTIIDKVLVPAKKIRLKTTYDAKTDEIKEQIDLVDQELKLQDKKNRSKTTEDFENQIGELQKRLDTSIESNKTVVENYEQQIKDLNYIIQKNTLDKENDYEFYSNQRELTEMTNLMINSDFHPQDFLFAINNPPELGVIYDKSVFSSKVYSFLSKQEFVESFNDGFRYSGSGIKFIKFVTEVWSSNNEKKTNIFLNPNEI